MFDGGTVCSCKVLRFQAPSPSADTIDAGAADQPRPVRLRPGRAAGITRGTRLINNTPRPTVTRSASPTAKPQCSNQRPDNRSLGTAQPTTSSARRTL
ncbi:hypothetical protein ASF73_16780 [Xanthomonas sp. Leaf131]|nr:hypothetical protein ASF73_16780 [Xanthomonas sp. Leaf131]